METFKNKAFDLKGKTALITGACGLLGKEHALSLLESGADLVLTDINLQILSELKEKLGNDFKKQKIYYFAMDVTSEEDINNVQYLLAKKNTSVNILVNNAAMNPKIAANNSLDFSNRFENFSLNEWNKQIAVGLTGAFLCSKVFGREMAKSNNGCILNISSDLSVIAPDQRIYMKDDLEEDQQPVKPVTYSVLKAGLVGLTKYLATYWINSNIRCNSLSPGGVYTNQPYDFVENISKLIPLGRMARKEEYRAAVQFLCSDASSYMNGHNLVMDGGRSIW